LLRHDFEHAAQVVEEPVLAGDGAGVAGGLVLVVVHENNAVGVGGNRLQVGIGRGNGGVDVEPQVTGMEVAVELLDKGQIGRYGVVGKALKIERKAAIHRIRSEELANLPAQKGALAGVLQDVAEAGVPGACRSVVVVQVREDFSVFVGCLDDVLDLAFVVGIVDG